MQKLFIKGLFYIVTFTVFLYFGLYTVIRNPVLPFSVVKTSEVWCQKNGEFLKQHVQNLLSILTSEVESKERQASLVSRYVEESLKKIGYEVEYQVVSESEGALPNIVVRFQPEALKDVKTWVVVSSYFSANPNENINFQDSLTGVTGFLELARMIKKQPLQSSLPVEMVFYGNDFENEGKSSVVHVQSLKQGGRDVKMMMGLQSIGNFSTLLFSQKFPSPFLNLFYPWRGNFIGVVSNTFNYSSVREVKKYFLGIDGLDTLSINAPVSLEGIGWSRHRPYWQEGWAALKVTDTSYYRQAKRQRINGESSRLDYSKMAKVVDALFYTLMNLKE